jgi:hypothetical protein
MGLVERLGERQQPAVGGLCERGHHGFDLGVVVAGIGSLLVLMSVSGQNR